MSALLPWLVAFVAVTWLAPRRARADLQILLGVAGLAWLDPLAAAVALALGAVSHALLRTPTRARTTVTVGLAAAAFVVSKLGVTLGDGGGAVALVGLAFLVLRVVHVALDRRAGRLPALAWRDHLAYLFFLPLVVCGPLQPAQDFARDGARLRFDRGLFAEGLERLLYGAVKLVVFAGWVAWHLDVVHARLAPGSLAEAWLGCFTYGFRLYFQFAGWSDVAIGFAAMVGRRPPENFSWPMLARSPAEFWTRWHASLSAWCRRFVYEPLVAHTRSAALGVGASLLVIGLWHELSLRYLVWAAWHAAIVVGGRVVETRWRRRVASLPAPPPAWVGRMATVAGVLVTQQLILFSFAFTRSPDLAAGWRTFVTLVTGGLAHV